MLWIWNRWDRKSTRLNSSHANISYAVFCLKKKKKKKKKDKKKKKKQKETKTKQNDWKTAIKNSEEWKFQVYRSRNWLK